jgi:RNA 2',3'-cyclic 3'-phosphodiesterase
LIRLFVAAFPPAPVLDDLAELVNGLHLGRAVAAGVNVRLAPPERWHLTMAFLGDVDPIRVPDARDALGKAVAGWSATAPELRLAGGGRFGRGRFTIMWAGVGGDVAAVTLLAKSVRRQLKRARLPFDDKPFRPHLTLARPSGRLGPAEVAADLAALRAYQGPSWTVGELQLVRSHLGPDPGYETVGVFELD